MLDLRAASAHTTLLERVVETLSQRDPQRRPIVQVVNLEGSVEYNPELAPTSGPGVTFLATANLQREQFSHDCPAPLVLWMTELLERAFIKQAPDLWHWRSHVFDLRTRFRPIQSLITPDGRPMLSDDHRLHPETRVERLAEELAAYRRAGLRREEMMTLNAIGIARQDAGDAKLALNDFNAVLQIAREIGDRRGEGNAMGNLGLAHANLGDARKAIEFYEQHLVIAREIGDRREEGNAMGNLGNAHAALGDARKAIEFYEQQIVIAREIGDRRGEGNALGNLGIAHAALGDAHKAIGFYEQALVLHREIGDRRGEGTAMGNLGNAHAALGDARKAIEFYEQQLVIAREIGNRRGEGNALWNSALSHGKLGERAAAILRAEAALRIHEAIEDPNEVMVRTALARWRGAA